MHDVQTKKIISYFLENDILLTPEHSEILKHPEHKIHFYKLVERGVSPSIIENELNSFDANKTQESKPSQQQQTPTQNQPPSQAPQPADSQTRQVEILRDYDFESQKRGVEHFVSYFNQRYKKISLLLKQRKELSSILSIARLKAKKDKETVAIIGMIRDKEKTKNDNFILTVEDPTGEIKVLINKNNQEIFNIGKDLVEDEVIGIVGMNGDNILFSNNIIQPDIPLDKEIKKYDKDESVAFISDVHFGSKDFLEKEFDHFINWLRAETGTEKQKEIAKKVKYLFIVGDLVDGVGIYPGQEEELTVPDVEDQYKGIMEKLKKVPKHIPIILCPGNHDAVRLSEPQPKLDQNFSKCLNELENLHLVSNPAMVNICSNNHFSGFDILLYHGYSFDYYAANIDSIRQNGGYDRADLIMKFMLKRRHLAPAYKSVPILPEPNNDALVIDHIPDFFITGHIHKTAVSNYRNVTTICGSCWQAKTAFQEKVGHHPEPARVPVVNLKTRKVTLLNFETGEAEQ